MCESIYSDIYYIYINIYTHGSALIMGSAVPSDKHRIRDIAFAREGKLLRRWVSWKGTVHNISMINLDMYDIYIYVFFNRSIHIYIYTY